MRDAARLLLAATLASAVAACVAHPPASITDPELRAVEIVELPPPDESGAMSVEEALAERRSRREFADADLPPHVIGQLLWAGQGVTDDAGHRASPSAGALYPLELYALTDSTLLHYLPEGHRAERRDDETTLDRLAEFAFGQEFVSSAPAVLIITAVVARTESKYGARAAVLVERESGHAAQNILLAATALDLAATPVGGFDPAAVARLLALPPGEEVVYLIPVGYPVADGA